MKATSLLIPLTLFVCGAVADDKRPVPQPRLRLDPISRNAVPSSAMKHDELPPRVVQMDKVVVKERSAIPMERPRAEEPLGNFSLLGGGRIVNRDRGAARFEVGVWPSIDLMVAESPLKPRPEPRLNVDFVRIKR